MPEGLFVGGFADSVGVADEPLVVVECYGSNYRELNWLCQPVAAVRRVRHTLVMQRSRTVQR